MKITSVTYKMGMTYTTGSYNNIRPEIVVSADLTEDDENMELVFERLHALARGQLHAAVDQALEDEDKPPKFFDGPRYAVVKYYKKRLAILLPEEMLSSLPDLFVTQCNGRRLSIAMIHLRKCNDDNFKMFNCADGDLSRMREIPSGEGEIPF